MIDLSNNGHGTATPTATPAGQTHIFLALASHDYRVHTRFMMSLVGLIAAGRFKITVSNVSSGGVHKARNNLAWEFLTKSDAQYYLSVDGDISFTADNVSRLIAHDKDVIGAPYTHKKPEIEWSARAIKGVLPDPRTHLQELSATGTGFLLVKRRVFEKIRADHPEILHYEDWTEGRGEPKWDFFSEGVVIEPGYYDQPTFLSEDFYFCHRARQAGFPVYCDTAFHVMHWEGGRGYPEPQKAPAPTPPPAPPAESLPLPVAERMAT